MEPVQVVSPFSDSLVQPHIVVAVYKLGKKKPITQIPNGFPYNDMSPECFNIHF